jgi:transposase
MLQPYLAYLQDRWQQGCTNASRLFHELLERGYQGSYSLIRARVHAWRIPRSPPVRRRRRSAKWLCLRPREQLGPDEQEALDHLLTDDAEVARGYDLLQRFRTLVRARDGASLEGWLADAQDSALPAFVAFANGILADRAAVDAALSLPWSNGPVEGHIHRLKLIKRQGYGRAKLDLLKTRVLAA